MMRKPLIFPFVFGMVGVWSFWLWRDFYRVQFSDVPFHLRMIEQVAQCGVLPGDPFFPGYPTPLHAGLLHWIGAGFYGLTGNLHFAWAGLGVIHVMLAGGVGWFLGKRLFAVAGWKPLCAATFMGAVFLDGGIPIFEKVAVLLVWAGWTLNLSPESDARRVWREGVLGAVLIGLAIGVRLFSGLIGYAVWAALCGRGWAKKGMTGAQCATGVLLPLAVAAPWLGNALGQIGVLASLPAVAESGPAVTLGAAWRGQWRTAWQGMAGNWLPRGGAIYWAALVLPLGAWFCFKAMRRELGRWARLGWAAVLMALLVPWSWILARLGAGNSAERMVDIAGRLAFLIPIPLFWAGWIQRLFAGMENLNRNFRKGWGRRWKAAIRIAGVAVALVPVLFFVRYKIAQGRWWENRFAPVWAGSETVLRDLKGKTVLSDPWTTYFLAAEFGFYGITIPRGHSSAMVPVDARRGAMRPLLAGELSDARAELLLSRYPCDYILLNKRFAARRGLDRFDFIPDDYSPGSYEYMIAREGLDLVHETENLAIFRVRRD